MSTRDRILDAAAQVIETLGMARATTKEIARAAGFSEATLYKYFHSKEDLFLRVLMERMPNFIELMKRLKSLAGCGSVTHNLIQIATATLDFYSHTLPISSALFSAPELLESLRVELRKQNAGPHKANQAVTAYVLAEQDLGRLPAGLEPEAVAYMLLGACFQRAYWSCFLGEPLPPETRQQFITGLVNTLLLGAPLT